MRRAGPDRRVALLVCASLWAALSAPSSEAQEPLTAEEDKASSSSADVPQFGGPSSVAGRLSGDAEPKESYYRYRGLERGLGPSDAESEGSRVRTRSSSRPEKGGSYDQRDRCSHGQNRGAQSVHGGRTKTVSDKDPLSGHDQRHRVGNVGPDEPWPRCGKQLVRRPHRRATPDQTVHRVGPNQSDRSRGDQEQKKKALPLCDSRSGSVLEREEEPNKGPHRNAGTSYLRPQQFRLQRRTDTPSRARKTPAGNANDKTREAGGASGRGSTPGIAGKGAGDRGGEEGANCNQGHGGFSRQRNRGKKSPADGEAFKPSRQGYQIGR